MDTLRLIKIDNDQLLIDFETDSANFSQKFKIDEKIKSIKDCSRKINYDILNHYIKNGPSQKQLKYLQNEAFRLFNILNLFELKHYFAKIKSSNKIHHLHLVLDADTNLIPFEILHDGKDFLSDYMILSRESTDTKQSFSHTFNPITLNQKFAIVGNPSESSDIDTDVMKELDLISPLIDSNFNLRGPFKYKNVTKIELIRLLSSNALLHFSGHYKDGGWNLFEDSFKSNDINKCSEVPNFLFSNTCGDCSIEFINYFLDKGSKTIISTSGFLPSKRATELSSNFYNFFIQHNRNCGESLFLARKEMIKKYGLQDFFWCYYRLYGSSYLSIDKTTKTKFKNYPKITIKKFISLLLLILVSFSIYYFIINKSIYQKELNIKYNSNINSEIQDTTINMGEIYDFFSKDSRNNYYSLFLKCDSIKLNEKPYFSLNSGPPNYRQIFQFILDDIDYSNSQANQMIVKYPYEFNEEVLSTFLSNKNNFNRLELFFEDDIEYSVYLRYDKRGSEDFFTLHIVNISNNLSYKIDFRQLLKMPFPIHKDYLDDYIDNSSFPFPRDSQFELIKKDFKFKDYLIIDIKKALFK